MNRGAYWAIGPGVERICPLFTDDIIICTENSKDTTRKKLPDFITEFCKSAGYKLHRNVLLVYILIIHYQKEKLRKQSIYKCIKKKIPMNKSNKRGKRTILRKL